MQGMDRGGDGGHFGSLNESPPIGISNKTEKRGHSLENNKMCHFFVLFKLRGGKDGGG